MNRDTRVNEIFLQKPQKNFQLIKGFRHEIVVSIFLIICIWIKLLGKIEGITVQIIEK